MAKTVLHLDITEVLLVYFNVVDNYYQQDSRILYKIVLKKSSGQLLKI